MDWSKLGKEDIKAVYCYLVYLTLSEQNMHNAWLDDSQARIKIAGRNINILRYDDDISPMKEI